MKIEHYNKICKILSDKNELDLIRKLTETTGYNSELETQKHKKQIEAMTGMKEKKQEVPIGFGEEIWEWIKSKDDIFEFDEAQELMEMALRYGLVKKEIFDPELHDSFDINFDLEKGDQFW